jgi:cytoskeleton protein RodZ
MTEVESKESQKAIAARKPATLPATVSAVPPPIGPAPTEAESFGSALAAARKARGLSLSEVALQLRLQLRQVRAIEAEDLAALPEGPFVRGFVRNYAKLVELPAEPLLALLAARLKPTEPLRSDGAGAAAVSPVQLAAREHASRLTVVGGAVAVLVLFAVLGWWTMRPAELPPAPLTTAVPAIATVSPLPSSEGATQPSAEPVAVEPPPSESEAAEANDAAAGPAASPTALRFSFRDRSWVEIRQADGVVLMSQNNEAGTQRTVEGTPPYTLVVGNASKVDLEFGGKSIDLPAAASRGDVARLQLE